VSSGWNPQAQDHALGFAKGRNFMRIPVWVLSVAAVIGGTFFPARATWAQG
jgi:hypothetical protein